MARSSKKTPNEDDLQSVALQLLQERQQLPIWEARKPLVQLLESSDTVVLVGETGSGKTTQAPQFVQLKLNCPGLIACTQPRRIAAVTVAQRVAAEQGVAVGTKVGYSVRFDDSTGAATKIKYMTDGMLIREAISDAALQSYSCIFVDEAHERTVNTDVLLGLLKQAQQARYGSEHPLKLVIMSATLDQADFLTFFPGSSPAYIEGRQYPVEIFYTAKPQESYLKAAIDTTLQIHMDEDPGFILVFLTGQDEIELAKRTLTEAAAQLKHPQGFQLVPVPMYAALPPEEQANAFAAVPEDTRKVILATNIAETSVTVPGVRYVVDTGVVKARAFSAARSMESLQVVAASKAQCRQRSGRAGREAPGKCFRLFPEAAFQQLPEAALPEIQRSNLVSVVLQLKAIGVRNVLEFDLMDPPPRHALKKALASLYALQAMDSKGDLTPLGQRMAQLPVDPPLAALLIAAGDLRCCRDAVAIVSLISSDRVFLSPSNQDAAAAAAHKAFYSALGDHIALLNAMRAYEAVAPRKRAQWCRRNFLSHKALRHAERIQAQLLGHLERLQVPLHRDADHEEYSALRRALVKGLFQNCARRQPDGRYVMYATSQEVHLHPGSVLVGGSVMKRPACVVFHEVILTNRPYAHLVTAVEASWLPELVPRFFSTALAANGS